MATPPEILTLDSSSEAADSVVPKANQLAIPPSDGELLMLFVNESDEVAFAELIERHGAMVWHVCRGILYRQQDAEDAYQATFLLLASQAKQVRSDDSAAGWLYRVAYRTALSAKRRAKRRREERLESEPASQAEEAFPNLMGRQMVVILLEELRSIPKKYQEPLVMRYLEGQSRRKIADQTGTTIAGVQGMLARGKQLLRSRLIRRGVSLSIAMGLISAAHKAAFAAPPRLITQTTASCQALATAGTLTTTSAAVATLFREGLRSMLYSSMTKPMMAVVACSIAMALWFGAPAIGESFSEAKTPEVSAELTLENLVVADSPSNQATPTVQLQTNEVNELPINGVATDPKDDIVPNAVFIPSDLQGLRFGDMGSNGKKLSDTEQSKLLKEQWAKKLDKEESPIISKEPSFKELHLEHVYWNQKHDLLKRKAGAIFLKYNDKSYDDLMKEERQQIIDAELLTSEIFKAQVEMLRLEREMNRRALGLDKAESLRGRESLFNRHSDQPEKSLIVQQTEATNGSMPEHQLSSALESQASAKKEAAQKTKENLVSLQAGKIELSLDKSGNATHLSATSGDHGSVIITAETIDPPTFTVQDKPELSINELNQRGWQYFYKGKNKEAEADFREILGRDKKHMPAVNGLAFSLLNQGNVKEAKPLFEKYLKKEPKASGPLNGLARCLAAEGDVDGAIKLWEKGAKLTPGASAHTTALAFTYFERKEYAKAIPHFELLVKSNPKNVRYTDGLAKSKAAMAKQGDKVDQPTGDIPRIIERGDDKPDGKKSLGGSGP